ncbi:MAG TPA: cellulase family glycosylhydrolase [Pyrinomonadaceae bacterium]|nr:cellulase family glycosylhydrolase [Pyrinomonadaceae bacterium]
MDRRRFLQNAAGATLISLAGRGAMAAQDSAHRLKIVVFRQEGFPTIDGLNLSKQTLQTELEWHDLTFADADELTSSLTKGVDLFINPFGSAFPKTAWLAILKYLQGGGNFLNLGGVPFAVPVEGTKPETRQVNYHKRLGILQAFELDGAIAKTYRSNVDELKDFAGSSKVVSTFELNPRLTTTIQFPEEAGGDGAREGKMTALVHGLDANGTAVSAPVVMFDRLEGEFAGGRWVFANFTGSTDAETIKNLAEIASLGAVGLTAEIEFACYRADELPKLKIVIRSPYNEEKPREIYSTSYRIARPDGTGSSSEAEGRWEKLTNGQLDVDLSKIAKINGSGFYRVEIPIGVSLTNGPAHRFATITGFWVVDDKLMSAGEPITSDRHFLYRHGEPFPVVGTTYMASDVHRRFLLEPNPAVWDKDFAAMKAAGVNMVRTGIWTAWPLYFDEKGDVKEEVLRAFEAFILTAKKYDIPVVFTFFAFMPEMFGGKNAYLDPRSIAGQKKFITAFAARVKNAKNVIWDLINEPSFANPKSLWSCRPNGDEFEKTAWREWLKTRFNETDETGLADIIREKWRLTTEEDVFALPTNEDFDDANIQSNRRPLRAMDFRLFAQDIFRGWASEMRDTLRAAGNALQLVTVGQDEAGTGDSPSPQFHFDAVDFTSLHNWWSNDDLLWDNVVSKSPSKPNLVEETGVMSYEKLDGSLWRTEQEVAALLARKMALSLGANACGFIEWIWNTNPYMNIDNEAGIGFHRVDGTAKPELESFKRIAKFANENRKYFRGKTDEKAVLIIPHSYQFTPRSLAGDATKRAVRAFHYHCRQTLRAVSEYNAGEIVREAEAPKLVIVPAPHVLTGDAWHDLVELARKGSVVAVTGCLGDDEYLIAKRCHIDLGLNAAVSAKPVSQTETVMIGGKQFRVRFAGEKIQRVEKADVADNKIVSAKIGSGQIVWCPVPLELGENIEPVAAFYDLVLSQAGLAPTFSLADDNPAILVRPTEFADAVLYTIVSESGRDENVKLTHLPTKTVTDFRLPAGRTNLMFIDKRSGNILSRMI